METLGLEPPAPKKQRGSSGGANISARKAGWTGTEGDDKAQALFRDESGNYKHAAAQQLEIWARETGWSVS